MNLVRFLELYGLRFNYDKIGLSIRKGGYYFDKVKRGYPFVNSNYSGYGGQGKGFALAVENPQDPSLDIGGGCFKIRDIQRAFVNAY